MIKTSNLQDKTWLNLQFNDNRTIIRPDELENDLKYPPIKVQEKILNRIQGSIAGMALGDALGAHVEFRSREYLEENPVTDLIGGGTWGLKKGEFTDDTSMALCLGISLVACQDFNLYDQLVRYKWWYKYGYMSPTGQCFDIGMATRKSLNVFESRQEDFARKHNIPLEKIDSLSDPKLLKRFDVNCSEKDVAGNGALMRLAPVPLFFHCHPKHAVEFSGMSGRITHGDPSAYDACRYYGALIVAALQGYKRSQLLDNNFYTKHIEWFNNKPLHPDIMKIAQGSYKRRRGYKDGIRGKGYIVQALEAALWAFWSDNKSFERGALAAVNLGDDTDTTAAIYGQLAGACYGHKQLPTKWLEHMYAQSYIRCLSEWIAYEGCRWKPDKSLAFNSTDLITDLQYNDTTTSSTTSKSNLEVQDHSFPPKHRRNSRSTSKNTQTFRSTSQPARQRESIIKRDEIIELTSRLTQHNSITTVLNTRQDHNSKMNSDSKIDPNVRTLPTNPNSPQFQDSKSTSPHGYFHGGLKSEKDVCRWLGTLGDEYKAYVRNFERNLVDGFWLLNYVNDDSLIQYKIENPYHRQVILRHIDNLKKQCSF